MHRPLIHLLTLLVLALLPPSVMAQGLFSPAITVNEKVITEYELQQRVRMLEVLNAPGDPQETARKQLIEDRLKLDAAQSAGINPTEAEIRDGMEEFAGRANLGREEFVKGLESAGVAEQTFRDFVRAGLSWRQLIRQRFGPRAQISESEIDRAQAGQGGSDIRILASEIILPAPPPRAEAARALAARISQLDSIDAFSAAARKYSASPSRGRGGRLDWQNLSDLPPPLRPILLGLAPGEVSDPLPIKGAIALFQLRAIEEGAYSPPSYAAIEYATYLIPGGRSEAALEAAHRVDAHTDTCDDLYGINKGQPAARLQRTSLPPDKIPTDIAVALASLDPGEISTALTTADGRQLKMLMLCGRTPAIEGDGKAESRKQIAEGLRNRRLNSYANGYLAQLKADARIVER